VCVQAVGCFAGHQLNYVAQGAASGASMEGKLLMVFGSTVFGVTSRQKR
jgi:hypothetical protein